MPSFSLRTLEDLRTDEKISLGKGPWDQTVAQKATTLKSRVNVDYFITLRHYNSLALSNFSITPTLCGLSERSLHILTYCLGGYKIFQP